MLATALFGSDLMIVVGTASGAEAPDAFAAGCLERTRIIARVLGGTVTRGSEQGFHLAVMICPLPSATAGGDA